MSEFHQMLHRVLKVGEGTWKNPTQGFFLDVPELATCNTSRCLLAITYQTLKWRAFGIWLTVLQLQGRQILFHIVNTKVQGYNPHKPTDCCFGQFLLGNGNGVIDFPEFCKFYLPLGSFDAFVMLDFDISKPSDLRFQETSPKKWRGSHSVEWYVQRNSKCFSKAPGVWSGCVEGSEIPEIL